LPEFNGGIFSRLLELTGSKELSGLRATLLGPFLFLIVYRNFHSGRAAPTNLLGMILLAIVVQGLVGAFTALGPRVRQLWIGSRRATTKEHLHLLGGHLSILVGIDHLKDFGMSSLELLNR
jgi:hypothetical protein